MFLLSTIVMLSNYLDYVLIVSFGAQCSDVLHPYGMVLALDQEPATKLLVYL